MRKVKLRRSMKPEIEPQDRQRIPKGIYWTLLALILVIGVWQYDQRQQRIAQSHVSAAERLIKKSDYATAILEYRQAMDNPRLSRKEKAELALKIAELYDRRLDDPELALAFYNRARRLHPRTVDKPEIKAKMAELREKIATRGAVELFAATEETSGELTQEVRLLAPPPEDRSGKVIAHVGDTEIRAGAVARYLAQRGYPQEFLFNPKDQRIDQMIDEFFQKELAFRAAVAEGMHLRSGIAAQLYDYQRTLLGQQWMAEQREKSRIVSDDEIKSYYENHRDRFSVPERLSVGAIAATTETPVLTAKQLYEKGASWRDLNTSFTTHRELMGLDGLLGVVESNETRLPVVGDAGDLMQKLRSVEEGKTVGPLRIGDYYWLFVVFKRLPKIEKTLDEVRGQIEITLRSQKLAQMESQLKESLRKKYPLQIEKEAKARIIEQLKAIEGLTTNSESVPRPTEIHVSE